MKIAKNTVLLFCLINTCLINNSLFAKTIDEIKQRGYLQCGVSQSLLGFSYREKNTWTGLDVDICRAVAAAIFGYGNAVKFTPLSTQERFNSLKNKTVDILSRNTTFTYSRDTALGITFTNITYYDGQGFMVPKILNINTIADLANKAICTRSGTTSDANIKDYFSVKNIPYKLLTFTYSDREVLSAYHSGKCQAYSGDRSALAAQRQKLKNPNDHIILSETISKEPLGPAVRNDDQAWENLVKWVIYGLITAEEYGLTKHNISENHEYNNPKISLFLGISNNIGSSLGLDKNFMRQAILAVGNYGEIFDRNLGKDSKLKLPRGLNNLWSNGGLMYAPPFS